MTNLLRVVLVCLLTWSPVRPAFAQEAAPDSANQARAKVLFQEGRALVAEGRYAEACPLLEQSSKLLEGIGTLFNLADCWERLRRTRSAAVLYRKVERLALASGQDQRAEVASQRARNLETSLSKILIRLEDPHTATNVRQNGEDVPKENLGSPFAVDPGTYQIVASSPGKRSWSLSVEVPQGAVIVTVLVPVLDDVPDAKQAKHAAVAALPAKPGPTELAVEPAPPVRLVPRPQPVREEPPRPVRPAPWRRPAALVLAGVGIGGMVAGAVFGAQFRSSNKDAESVCPSSYDCSNPEIAQHEAFVNDARRARTLSVIGFGVGLAALGSAAAIHFTTPRTEKAVTASAEWSPYGLTATLRGRF